jgi:hypothetical protein
MTPLELAKQLWPNYKPDWYHYLWEEEYMMAKETNGNVIASSPPGSGKTQFWTILVPVDQIYSNPMSHGIVTTNSDNLSRLAGGEVLRTILSPQFQELCPLELTQATGQQFTVAGNDGRPTMHCGGIRGQLTGHRASWLVFDDLIKNLQEAYSEVTRESIWGAFNSAAETRLLPTGQIFGIHTRWHLDDPIGKLLKRARENPMARQFRYINLAATNLHGESFIEDTSQ